MVVDYSSITNPSKAKKGFSIPTKFMKDYIKRNNLRLDRPVYSGDDHYISTKGSPNGSASWSSF